MGQKRSIPSKESFKEIFSSPDHKFSTNNILVLCKSNSLGFARLGVAIRKKDNRLAVDRNNIKRKIKGSFRSKVLELPHNDFVVFVKRDLKGKERELKKDLEKIWAKF
jgi:ribonuclease P protein component